jgi:hypothetical protein
MKKNIIFLSLLSFVFICGIFYPLNKFLSKDKAKDLKTLTVERAKSSIKAITPYLNKAIENSNDTNLITYIEAAAKIENITTCFILNKNGKIIIHNNVREWNTEKDSNIYNKAIAQRIELLQQMSDENFLLFSEPIAKNCTLFCIFSIQKANKMAKYWEIKYYTICLLIAFLIAIAIYFFSKLLVLLPFNRTEKL